MRRFFIEKVENMRDIGGYTVSHHEVVKSGKIIRSNCITNLSEKEIEEILNMSFNTVIDLRSDKEIEKKNGVFFNNDNFRYNHIGLKGDGRLPDSKDDVLNTYIEMLEGKEEIKNIFEIFANAENGIIYYCNAGKDRTGVITACLLKLLGVDNQDIIVDYLASATFLKNMIKDFASSFEDVDILPMITPHYETMEKLLEYIDKEYGSIDGYLSSCGVSQEKLSKIKEKYIEDIKV